MSTVATAPLHGRALFRAWFRRVTVAEFAGFAAPACAGALTAGAPVPVAVTAVLAAGAVEGAALGWGQASILRRALPGLPHRRWIARTSAAAVFAYLIGLAPSALAGVWAAWWPPVVAALAAVLGTALLTSIGLAQWTVLRHLVPGAGRWIVTTAAAWAAGLAVFLGFTMPLWRAGQPLALTVAIGMAGGLLMAATTAALTGAALRRILRDARIGTVSGTGRDLRP